MPSELIKERRIALWELTESLLLRNTPTPLSGLWERFVLDLLLPEIQSYPAKAAAGKAPEVGQEQRAMYQKSCALDPFDFTDAPVNKYRAGQFVKLLELVRKSLARDGQLRTRWWPVSRMGMIETIKAERERLGRQVAGVAGGMNGGGSSGGSGSSSIKKEPHDAAPATSGAQNDLVKDPSNNKRKAEDSSSTKTTTELPATSTENSNVKIKRPRKAE